MQTKVIPNYGRVTLYKYLNRTLNKYLCKWAKGESRYRYISGKLHIVAPDMDTAIIKASALKGYKPCLIQRV